MFANTRNCSDNKESTDSNEATCTAASKPSCGLSLNGFSRPKDTNTHHYHAGFALSTDKSPQHSSQRSNLQRPIHKSMDVNSLRKYDDRYATFNLWPKAHPVRKDQLARAGFFYTGEGDKVICPWCNICLNEWEAFDLPIEEHKRHSPYCDFILMLFPMLQ